MPGQRGYPSTPRVMTLGLDLGQSNDYSALTALVREADDGYRCLIAERWRGESYTKIVPRLDKAIDALQHWAHSEIFHAEGVGYHRSKVTEIALVVDATGVGTGVVDLLEEQGFDLVRILISGGHAVSDGPQGGYVVPKSALVTAVQLLLQQDRLRIPRQLPHARILQSELMHFEYEISASGHIRYGAAGAGDTLSWRERPHDDLVLSIACACWYAEKEGGTGLDVDTLRHFAWKGKDAALTR